MYCYGNALPWRFCCALFDRLLNMYGRTVLMLRVLPSMVAGCTTVVAFDSIFSAIVSRVKVIELLSGIIWMRHCLDLSEN